MTREFRLFMTAFAASFVWMSVAPVPASAASVAAAADASAAEVSAELASAESAGASASLAAAAPESGGHSEDGHGPGKAGVIPNGKQFPWQFLTAIVSFGVVMLVMATRVWPRITAGLDERASKIREEIDAAEEARGQARDALAQYESSLAEARAEAQKMVDETRAQQQEVAKELRASTEKDLAQLRERAMRDIDAAHRAAVEQVHAEAVALGTAIATRILDREVSVTDQDRLLSESIAELQSAQA